LRSSAWWERSPRFIRDLDIHGDPDVRQINDPRWIQFSAELERDVLREAAAGAEHREDIGRRALALQAWREWRAESAERVLRYFLPHNRITLINYLASAYLLLVSTIVVTEPENSPTVFTTAAKARIIRPSNRLKSLVAPVAQVDRAAVS
jgi:hypothetical protein